MKKSGRSSKLRPYRKRKEELLEIIWTLTERGEKTLETLLQTSRDREAERMLEEMSEDELLEIKDGRIELSGRGQEIARGVIRRHRLAEVLLTEILEASDESAHSQACEFEHILNPEITDSICTLLGHPPTCPHSKSIPPGECCRKYKKEVEPLVIPLTELEVGREAKIVFMTPKQHRTLDKLSTIGIVPGSSVKLHQKAPALVVRSGETELAFDERTARNIFVKRV